ncbi:AraC-type DNA-binding protein [Amycolatopsis pretoriensis]|uniref:AraC-type DNA-binding protein n=1 Tax=Amycolatopsis pretoriensis TaxID=218821 RepID=A0A1H5R3W4_9PSEU|nr:helix-turn-helix transcriptional regulator [Amycolatopsis pretoriensis]SEF32744.1 AraC-type DNA-binding protein [Amycolatopsis pretoriensis]
MIELVRAGDPAVCEPLAHGDVVPAHFHDFGQLRYAASGALVTSTGAGTWVAPANRITWVPPFHVHSSRSHGRTDVRLLEVPAEPAGRLPAEPSVFAASALLREAFLATIGDPADGPRTRLLLEVVVSELVRAPREPLRLPEPRDARLKAVTDLLHADPANPATLAELGHRTGSSERTLSRLFATELSMGFPQWRTLLRVQRALLELGEGRSVTDTAIRLGWANPGSFIDAFTELVGHTPGRYRAAIE